MLNKEIIDNILASKIPFAVRRAYYINIKELRKELLEATNGWRSVKDELPMKSEYYLVYIKGLGRVIRYYNYTTKEFDIKRKEVTHWQPLPAKPDL